MATLRVLLAATLCAYAVGSLERMTPVLSLNKRHLVEGLSTDVFGNPVDTSSRLQIGGDDSPASMATLRLHGGSPQLNEAAAFLSLPSALPSKLKHRKSSRSPPEAMLDGDSHDAKYTIKGGRFSVGSIAKTLASAFIGITVFGSPISSAVAKGLGGFPLMMADGSKAGAPRKDSRKRVLMLLSDTGGGHKASAKAIQAALDELYPNQFVCEITDIYTEYGTWPCNTPVPIYQWAAKNEWPWRCIYYYGEIPLAAWSAQKVVNLRCYHNWRAYMQSFQPDIVVSVHPLCQVLPLKILDDMGGGKRKIPFVTVVTDLGSASRMWFHKGVDRCCVPGDAVEKLAFKNGLKPGQVKKHGLPVRQGFWRAAARRSEFKQARASLKLKDLPTVLVVGGGDGVGGLQKIALGVGEKLAGYAGDCQLVVVCGKNEKVKKALQAHPWASNVNVQVEGFVSNMDDYMVAADILVTKAGPGTIAEASILGLPTVLSGFLPGQEYGNIPYVVDGGFGTYEKDFAKIGSTVTEWLGDKKKLKTMSDKAADVGKIHSGATLDIARDIAELVL